MKKHAGMWGWIAGVLWFAVFLGGSALLWFVWGQYSWAQLGILAGFAPAVGYITARYLEL